MSGERTEKPTAKRRADLRRKGTSARSMELPQAAALLAVAVTVPAAVHRLWDAMLVGVTGLLSSAGETEASGAVAAARHMAVEGARAVALPVVFACAAGVLASVAVTRERPNMRLAAPKLERLNPKNGLKRVFSPQGLMELARTTAKLTLVVVVLGMAVGRGDTHIADVPVPLSTFIASVGGAANTILLQIAVAGLVIGVVDAVWARRRFGKQSRMSKQDVKDENKQTEGNPQIRSAIRGRQMRLSRNRMISAVAKADVVLANPTHIAVALAYEQGGAAPVVVAKGAGVIAERIKQEAARHGVPIREDKPLARALFRATEVGDEIPVELYRAVAEVLALVYAARRRGGAGTGRAPVASAPGRPMVPAAGGRPGPTTGRAA